MTQSVALHCYATCNLLREHFSQRFFILRLQYYKTVGAALLQMNASLPRHNQQAVLILQKRLQKLSNVFTTFGILVKRVETLLIIESKIHSMRVTSTKPFAIWKSRLKGPA